MVYGHEIAQPNNILAKLKCDDNYPKRWNNDHVLVNSELYYYLTPAIISKEEKKKQAKWK